MPVLRVSTKSKNGPRRTGLLAARSKTNRRYSLLAWSSRQPIAATARPKRVSGPKRYDDAVIRFSPPGGLLRRLAHGFPFAQRLSVARRNVRILRIGADGIDDFPRARALGALGEI